VDQQIQQLACLCLELQLLDVRSHVIPFDSTTFDYRYPEDNSERVIDQRQGQLEGQRT
jgi:hypothetical protein